MRLEKIKLAGFKSFVDPTILELKSNLFAVVGPNGCGKSNIIDAVRWVMGESSAKNLRGESMADVIFNGSNTRKPVSQASIELMFNNADGGLGGEYANYSEISIRRVVTRDGESQYFLNGTRCRRKDVTEVFLGTGLGPRSYAIIEQGMISRVIEAKPEELRLFLEEAAGISLYKERRKETEKRMNHTRENLERLQDLRQEQEKQVERLRRQSEAAANYQVYCQEQREVETGLHVLKWQGLQMQVETLSRDLRNHEIRLEEKLAERSHLDLSLEQGRLLRSEKEDALQIVQSRYYELGAEIARREQQLHSHQEQQKQLNHDLTHIELGLKQSAQQMLEDQANLTQLQALAQTLLPEEAALNAELQRVTQAKEQADLNLRTGTEAWEQFYQAAQLPQRTAEVQKTKIENFERQAREAHQRLTRIQHSLNETDAEPIRVQLQMLEGMHEQHTAQVKTEQIKLETQLLNIQTQKGEVQAKTQALYAAQTQCQSLKAEIRALVAMQQAALGKDNTVLQGWLTQHDWLNQPRLAETLRVLGGFDRALEVVLSNRLQTICLDQLPDSAQDLNRVSAGEVNVMGAMQTRANVHTQSTRHPDWIPLSAQVQTDLPVADWLSAIWIASSWDEAFARQSQLSEGESLITKDGLWLGPAWMKVFGPEGDYSGVIEREATLERLSTELVAAEGQVNTGQSELEAQQATLLTLEKAREETYRNHHQSRHQLAECHAKITAERGKLDSLEKRRLQLDHDLKEWQQGLSNLEAGLTQARADLSVALEQMTEFEAQKAAMQAAQQDRKAAQQTAHQAHHQAKEAWHAFVLRRQQVLAEAKSLSEGLSRLEKMQVQTVQQQTALQARLAQLEAPMEDWRSELALLLEQRLTEEQALTQARQALEDIDQQMRQWEKARGQLEQAMNEIRQQVDALRLDLGGKHAHIDHAIEKLQSLGCESPQDLIGQLPAEVTIEACQKALNEITQKIQKLGAINLAAIEEYQAESERMAYMDAQLKDVIEALTTLEAAIEKIDKETRATFKATFDQVDQSFKSLFPRLFGGGEAYLLLTGDDLLNTGVTVMARPPGKKNSSIHLLSGGEKALTAVALVFAIFQLNPAPFCLLDEVDAPLDDANVGRFCELVKYMSQSVQFVFITHNKLAMEMADALAGVTMKEPGVSRLVAVDVKEAVALAVQ